MNIRTSNTIFTLIRTIKYSYAHLSTIFLAKCWFMSVFENINFNETSWSIPTTYIIIRWIYEEQQLVILFFVWASNQDFVGKISPLYSVEIFQKIFMTLEKKKMFYFPGIVLSRNLFHVGLIHTRPFCTQYCDIAIKRYFFSDNSFVLDNQGKLLTNRKSRYFTFR